MSQDVGVKPVRTGHIPTQVQRAIGQAFKVRLEAIQKVYGVSDEDCLLVMLALVHGYASNGGLSKDQLCNLAFNVWQIHGSAAHSGNGSAPTR